MTSKLIVNSLAADTGVSTITFADQAKMGNAIFHSTGFTIGDSFLHSTGVNITNINATGVITATKFVGEVSVGSSITFEDNEKAYFGTGTDFSIYHNGSASYLDETGTGGLIVKTDTAFQVFNSAGSQPAFTVTPGGSVELYHNNSKKLETTASSVTLSDNLIMGNHHIELNDNSQIMLGNAPDMRIYHDGNSSFITNTTGDLTLIDESRIALRTDQLVINNHANSESIIYAAADGEVSLYHNGVKKFDTTGNGNRLYGAQQDLHGDVKFDNQTNSGMDLRWDESLNRLHFEQDNIKAVFGTSSDLEIYHGGGHSIINDSFGSLLVRSNIVQISTPAGSKYFKGQSGVAELYHSDSSKLATTVGGISVTGTTDTDNFVNAGVSTFVGIITASAVGNVIPFLFNNYSDLPAASSYHGAFAHVHTVAKGFFAHAGNWVEIVSKEADGRVGSGTETYNIKDLNVVGVSTFNNHVNLLDNDQLRIGTSADLGLYHDGSNSYIVDSGTGSLYIRGADVEIGTVGGNKYFLGSSSVSKIYHLNAEKFLSLIHI